ncbi:unnamed protein product [Spirodela intermedia]|uniref:Uncharacterized protein n=1 Tax=Spirodela intermedia TaxID=51605 RepID=A0A7I8LBJ7_SPIIN|nr:unnamed protein product [Spirodela intermedia]
MLHYSCSLSQTLPERRRCTDTRALQQLHAQMILTGDIHHLPSLNRLLSLYLSSPPPAGGPPLARRLFDLCPRSSVLLWNTLIRGLLDQGLPLAALLAGDEMLRRSPFSPDQFTFPSLLKACARLAASFEGRTLHGQVLRFGLAGDLYVQANLISMYSACGDLLSAREVFHRTGGRNQVLWGSMISALVKNNSPEEALAVFSEMAESGEEADEVTLTIAISACAELRDLHLGKRLHSAIAAKSCRIRRRGRRRSSVVLGTALVDMYAKCGAPDMAKTVFDQMPERNVVAWSAMISGFAQNNQCEEALDLLKTMLEEADAKPNAVTLSAALSACAQMGDLSAGRWIHAYIDRSGMEWSTSLMNSMADMYAKCGSIEIACEIFDRIPNKDVVSWNVVISGLAIHGRGELALEKFSQMQREGLKPDDITFIGVLSACSHVGLTEEGRRHYRNMRRVYGIIPKLEHDGCMVNLLCRAGMLEEAKEFIRGMAAEPGGEVWGALLGGCAVFDELELAARAAGQLLGGVETGRDGACVLLSNMLAGRRRWGDKRRVREFMEEKGIKKTPGCSSIEVEGVVHEFFSGESQDPE